MGAFSSVIGGSIGTASADQSLIFGGYYNQTNGSNSTIVGGSYNNTIGANSYAFGSRAIAFGHGELAFANGRNNYDGDAQFSLKMGRVNTSDSTPKNVLGGGQDVGGENFFFIKQNQIVFFTLSIVGYGEKNINQNDISYSLEIKGVIMRGESSSSKPFFIGTPSRNIYSKTPSNSNISANLILEGEYLKVQCVGEDDSEIAWFVKGEFNQTVKKFKTTSAVYFKAGVNSDWFNKNNWYSDEYFTELYFKDLNQIPNLEHFNVFTYGPTGALINIDNPLWTTPKLINTQNTTDSSGICITSSLGGEFTGTIIGTSTFIGASAASVNQNLYFSGSVNNNWYNIDNWFATNTFKTKSASLPDYNNEARMYTLASVDIDNANWKTPKLIDTINVVDPSGIYITSNLEKEFTGVISGASSFSGVNVVNVTDLLYFSGATNNNWYDINNWFISNRFKTQSLSLPSYNNTTCMYGSIPAYVSIDNADWKTPKLIDTTSVTHPSGIYIVSLVNNSFTGNVSGNSSFSGVNLN